MILYFIYLQSTSIYLRFYTHCCRIRFQASYFYGGVICTSPPTLYSCPGLGPPQVDLPLFSCGGVFRGAHEADLSIQISAGINIQVRSIAPLQS